MENPLALINELMVEVFNDILHIEATALREGHFKDVSITEVHTIEAIGLYSRKTMSEVAKKLNITVGTLTVAIKNLVSKGYVQRFPSLIDRRVVYLGLTKKGRVLFRVHQKFHRDLILDAVTCISSEELLLLSRTLGKIHAFLTKKYMALPLKVSNQDSLRLK